MADRTAGLVVSLLLLGTPLLARSPASPGTIVSRFYTTYVQLQPAGLPTPEQQKELAPYLSRRLLGLMDAARAYSEKAGKAHPDEKPPFVDGCLFASVFEGPKAFRIGGTVVEGQGFKVQVHFVGDQGVAWDDHVLLVREDGRYVIDDVLFSGVGAFNPPGRLSATLESREGEPQEPSGPPAELLKSRIVYSVPGMDQVRVRRDLAYRKEPVLKMDLYLPKDTAPTGGWPVVVLVHGGPVPAEWGLKEWGVFRSYGELIATSGMAAVTFNHRLNAPADYPRAADDVAALLAHVRAEARVYEIDPERVAVWAFSGGGPLLASVLAARGPHLRAAVSYYAFLGPPEGAPAEARLSALEQLKTGPPPLLIARAGRDEPALNATVDAFLTAAVAGGVTIDLLTHPTGRHGFDIFDDDDRSRAVIRRTVAFLRENLTSP